MFLEPVQQNPYVTGLTIKRSSFFVAQDVQRARVVQQEKIFLYHSIRGLRCS